MNTQNNGETSSHKPLTSFIDEDKPREKLERHGAGVLTNTELLAILVATGTTKKTVLELCQEMMEKTNNSLRKLHEMSLKEIQRFDGIGKAKAITIKAALEIGKRAQNEPLGEKVVFRKSDDIFNYIRSSVEYLRVEEIWIIYLRRDNSVIDKECLAHGSQTNALFDIKEIMRHVLEMNAINVVMVHNHPSGNLIASKQDKEITKRLKDACATFDIRLLDHIIVGQNDYFSFADADILDSL